MENKFLDAMLFRHACKEFDSTKKISDEAFHTILEMGRLSPSSFGFEPWKFVVVQNSALREKLKTFAWGAQGQLPTASHFVIILSRKKKGMLYGSDYIHHMLQDVKQFPQDVIELYGQFYEKFQKEDFKLLESDRTLFDWATKQTYIALANMMTGAAYMGIDSCPMEGFDATLTETFLKEDLGIDTEEFGAAVMVAFGYRKEEPREKSRQPLDTITTWYN
jgi:nitroreductase